MKFNIRTEEDLEGNPEFEEVSGIVFGNYGIEDNTTTITHIPSGLSICKTQSRKSARGLAKELAKSGIPLPDFNIERTVSLESKELIFALMRRYGGFIKG